MIKFDDRGLKDFQRKLKELEQNANKLKGDNSVPITELFHPNFMLSYTQFNTIEDMFKKSPFKIDSEEDFKAIDESKWDMFIVVSTKFDSWEEMQETAATEWTAKKLGF